MADRTVKWGLAGFALAGSMALVAALAPADSHAGIMRDIGEILHLNTKPPPPKPGDGLPRQGYACCNLHYKRDSINDGNYAELPMISAGTPVEVVSYDKNRAYINVNGRQMRLEHEYGREQESLQVWVSKVVLAVDPKPQMAAWPKAVRDAIYEGKIMVGMTREQVIAAVGHPLTSENVSEDQPTWRMWRGSRDEYQINFNSANKVKSVTGEDGVTSQVIYKPEK